MTLQGSKANAIRGMNNISPKGFSEALTRHFGLARDNRFAVWFKVPEVFRKESQENLTELTIFCEECDVPTRRHLTTSYKNERNENTKIKKRQLCLG